MIITHLSRTLFELISALIYGTLLAVIYSLTKVTRNVLLTFIKTKNSCKKMHRFTWLTSGIIGKCIFIFVASVGFMILTFFTTEGVIRLYMILYSVLSFSTAAKFMSSKTTVFINRFILKKTNKFPKSSLLGRKKHKN